MNDTDTIVLLVGIIATLPFRSHHDLGKMIKMEKYYATAKGPNYYVATRNVAGTERLVTTLGAFGRFEDAEWAAREANRAVEYFDARAAAKK